MKIATSHSMIKSILKDLCFYCFTFLMEGAVITILSMILSATLLLYDFVGIY